MLARAESDAYAAAATPVMRLPPDGTRTVRQDGPAIFLRGDGATLSGERPFLDRRDLLTGETTRLLHSPADAHETVASFAGGSTDHAVIWHESPAEPPHLWLVPLLPASAQRRLLTALPDPHPLLTGRPNPLIITDPGVHLPLSR